MRSVRSRRRLFSQASAMLARFRSVRPPRIQSRRPGPATLVAMTSLSRSLRASQRPRYSSVRPWVSARGGTGYISAVSMKLMPRSMARSSCAWASASVFCSPQVMVPRHTVDTSRSVPGSVRYFIVSPVASLSLGAGWKDSRSPPAARAGPSRAGATRDRAARGSGRRRVGGIEGGVAVGTGVPVGDDAREVEQLPVHQVGRNDARQRREGVLDPTREALLPFPQHFLGRLPLQVGLRAAEVARNDR